jgi:hypothetical protein
MRFFHNNTEITSRTERLDTSTYSMTYLIGEYIYIASDFPFNHLYLKLGTTKNIVSNTTMTVEYYGTSWNSVVELNDGTSGLSASGFIDFTPNRNYGWSMAYDSTIIGISKTLYDKYWTRISFDKNLTASIDLSFLGIKFSDDDDLFSEYPVFNDSNFLTAFKAAKTDWEEQEIKASSLIIDDLKKKNVIVAAEQVLDRKRFIGANTCKTAEIIFTAFGNDYLEQKKAAKEEYSKRLDLSQYNIDKDNNGILTPSEVVSSQGWLCR